MPKKDTGYTPTGRSKSNPTAKQGTPLKTPALKDNSLPASLKSPAPKKGSNMPNPLDGGPNKVATLPSARMVNSTVQGTSDKPGSRFPKLTKPTKMGARPPRI